MATSQAASMKPEWDYTAQAPYYRYRPNYALEAIDRLCREAGARAADDYVVADVGAGTGNLTLLLAERGLQCLAIEPNDAMREVGISQTQGLPVTWLVGTADRTGLQGGSVDLYAMGSSFNTTEREQTLIEAHRVLKRGGFFTCLWNHRDLTRDPIQERVERIIRTFVPHYAHGTRREEQTPVINGSGRFTVVTYFEVPQRVHQPVEHYLNAWRSVRNPHWDLNEPEGRALFDRIMAEVRRALGDLRELEMTYTTTVWVAKRHDQGVPQ